MYSNKNHPELLPGEVFITNADNGSFPQIGWETKRRGNVAYDISGQPLGNRWPGSFPVFAQKSEIGEKSPAALKDLE